MSSFKVLNPYDKSLVGEYEFDSYAKIQTIIDGLVADKKVVQNIPSFKRSEILERLAKLIKDNTEELATLITKEMGKTIRDARGEIERSANTALCAALEARNIRGEVLNSDDYAPARSKLGVVTKIPLGTILAITPFNFPINLAVHKIAPAFATGNVTLFKPGPQNYFSGKRLVELCYEAGVPKEALKLIMPDVPELTKLIESDALQCISFTGGTKTANAIAKNAGRKKLLLELGGNDPLIVMPDADIEQAVETAVIHRFGVAGQRCTASKRLFIHEKVYTEFKERLMQKVSALKIGNPLEEETFIGPVVNEDSAKNIEKRIQAAISEGAKLLIGGKREGAIIFPTVLENINLKSELVADETFGPVIPLIPFSDVDSLIQMINSTSFGLQAGVFTYDMRVIQTLFSELEVGSLIVNDGPGFRADHFPFGGVKDSGMGREGVKYAMDEMMTLKTLVI